LNKFRETIRFSWRCPHAAFALLMPTHLWNCS